MWPDVTKLRLRSQENEVYCLLTIASIQKGEQMLKVIKEGIPGARVKENNIS